MKIYAEHRTRLHHRFFTTRTIFECTVKNMMGIRIFIAVEITFDTQKKLAEIQDRLKESGADVNWVAPGNLHITLKFIGTFDEEKIESVVSVMREAVSPGIPFDLCYRGVGILPGNKNPRVVYAHAEDQEGILTDIHKKLDEQLAVLGIEREGRPFKAHITVGRIKTRKNIKKLIECVGLYNQSLFGMERITELVLMKSELSREGPVYTKLNSVSIS
ncbi:MAG: RNA 2',3'-cyclic phosphodiesterase [Candidatus Brocadiaceae bacterium]|nr:RNA 2',3'-cyclic phosphodiesterase [Candidatus Brocadiaceae bacterium]